MLVLSRKAGQKIHIGDDIVVEIRRIAGNRVTIALEAPRDMRILRGELHEPAHEFTLDLDDELIQHPFSAAARDFEMATSPHGVVA
jgi:carbon storage regulator CsrA